MVRYHFSCFLYCVCRIRFNKRISLADLNKKQKSVLKLGKYCPQQKKNILFINFPASDHVSLIVLHYLKDNLAEE